MAKKLERPQPSSSIANVLDLEAARAAIGQPSRHQVVTTNLAPQPPPMRFPLPDILPLPAPDAGMPAPQPFSAAPTGEFPSIMRQFQLTPAAVSTLETLLAAYGNATGLKLTGSEFLRAVLHALTPTIRLHEREARTIGRLKRPKNEARLFHKRDELERSIARAFLRATCSAVME